MKTKLLLIRHGETAWNAEHRIQGQLDIPLSPLGILQAARLAECLASESIEAVYSSGQSRAWLTAAPLAARLGLQIIAEPRLRERSFGVFEGLTLDEIAARYPAEFIKWRERDPGWRPDGGESGRQLIDRVMSAVTDIGARHKNQTVALVSHGGVLDVVYRAARVLQWHAPREHQMLNAAINRLTASASDSAPLALSIDLWGDVAHLHDSRDEVQV
ncbi:MAG TPA: histidine phosphatase family protein [Burkholderiaceae bacterium]|nr:histidine phosphatase family protein [Burkholderiaceae bacterium]